MGDRRALTARPHRPFTPNSARWTISGGSSAAAQEQGLEIALDLAFQCSPDHPYVKQHPEWFMHASGWNHSICRKSSQKISGHLSAEFRKRPSGAALWQELKDVVVHWIDQGVRIFRVDNPHTKPFPFWHWLIAEVKREYPDVLFLAEAFTRPKVMYCLAKLGFHPVLHVFRMAEDKVGADRSISPN